MFLFLSIAIAFDQTPENDRPATLKPYSRTSERQPASEFCPPPHQLRYIEKETICQIWKYFGYATVKSVLDQGQEASHNSKYGKSRRLVPLPKTFFKPPTQGLTLQ